MSVIGQVKERVNAHTGIELAIPALPTDESTTALWYTVVVERDIELYRDY